jgi:hypothetical protein
MGDITTGDFDRFPKRFPLGEAAARKVEDRLSALSVPEDQYLPGASPSRPRKRSRPGSPT